MHLIRLGFLGITSLTVILIAMFVRNILADFLTFFFNSYLAMAGTHGGDITWIIAQTISIAVILWLLSMLWKDFGKPRFDALTKIPRQD